MKNFLKEANIEKKLKNQTIDSMYQENLSYFMFTLKKSEKKYAEK